MSFFDKIEWHATIGDPTFAGWFTVFAYFLCAYYAYRVYQLPLAVFHAPRHRQRILWAMITTLLVLLGINKQLDLQSFFTATARYLALEQNWYEYRRTMQKIFIVTVGLCGISTMILLIAYYKDVIRRHLLAIFGLCTLTAFVLIRAISFHSIDIFIGYRVFGLAMNWILELGGIGLIALNARYLLTTPRPENT